MTTLVVVTVAAALAAAAHHSQVRPPEPPKAAVAPADDPQLAAIERARSLEAAGKYPLAVKAWHELARTGNGFASRRLGDIYARGAPGVDRDQAQALRWYREAELRGEVLAQAIRLR